MNEEKGLIFGAIGVFAVITLIVGAVIAVMSVETVGAGERGVLLSRGAVQDEVKQPGWHFVVPFVSNIVAMDVQTQKVEVTADSASKDLQSVNATVALNYHVEPSQVNLLYRDIGKDYDERVIQPAIQESVKAATAQFTAEELITKRPEVGTVIRETLVERLVDNYIVVEDFSIVNFSFSAEFNKAIEAKQTAEQEAKKAENDLRRIEVEAKQTIEKARAEAESIRIQGEALRENSQLVELKAVEKWDGKLPTYNGSGAVPFLNISQ